VPARLGLAMGRGSLAPARRIKEFTGALLSTQPRRQWPDGARLEFVSRGRIAGACHRSPSVPMGDAS